MLNARQVLEGTHVRLEPLDARHIEGLLSAGHGQSELFRWTTVPQDRAHMERYVDAALRGREAGTVVPFATVRRSDGVVVGSTRFFDIERWAWPAGHPRASSAEIDGCEIGYTWLSSAAIRTAINTEAKYLMLRQAFESWGAHRVCFHTDARNERSCAALARLGARFEGTLYAHRLSTDLKPRDSARYSILAGDWPAVSARLLQRLERPAAR
jgi:N-acetyltransferase